MTVDRQQGDAWVQQRLDELIEMGTPDVILQGHRSYFGNTIFVSINEPEWHGAIVTAYLQTFSPPLGDYVTFEVCGVPDEPTLDRIERALKAALKMVLITELGLEH